MTAVDILKQTRYKISASPLFISLKMIRMIFCFLLILPFISYANAAYMATFFTSDMKNLLKQTFFQDHEQSSTFFNNKRAVYCDHSTIEFNPSANSLNNYQLHYGHIQNLTVLAYAEDEHAQAILVHSIRNPSINQYPHVTISVSNKSPYTAVYSNDLWKRLVDNGIIEVNLDEHDKPQLVLLKNQLNEWQGKLSSVGKYEETQAYVKIMNQSIQLHGIVCLSSLWTNEKCQK